jgi:hypothetical protein
MSNDNEFAAKQVDTDFRKDTATVVLKFSDDQGGASVTTLPQSSLPMLLAALHDKLARGPVTPIDGQSLRQGQNVAVQGFQLQNDAGGGGRVLLYLRLPEQDDRGVTLPWVLTPADVDALVNYFRPTRLAQEPTTPLA